MCPNQCEQCNGTGLVCEVAQKHNVGGYWVFCHCPVGMREEVEQTAAHYNRLARREDDYADPQR